MRWQALQNGYLIGAFGDKTGNIWPKAIVEELPIWLLKETNKLEVVLYGTVGYGVSYYPYITDLSKARVKALMIEILRNNISLVAIGAAIIISYILLFSFLIVDTHDKECIYILV